MVRRTSRRPQVDSALRGARTSAISMGDPAIVFGAGPIGLLVITLLRAMGTAEITVFEPSPVRGAKAVEVGADTFADPLSVTRRPSPLALQPHHHTPSNARVSPPPPNRRCACCGPRGVLTVPGVAATPPFYQIADLVFKELSIRGSFIYQEEFDMAIDLLDRGVVNIDPLTSDVRGIESGPQAFAELRQAANLVKVLLTSTRHST